MSASRSFRDAKTINDAKGNAQVQLVAWLDENDGPHLPKMLRPDPEQGNVCLAERIIPQIAYLSIRLIQSPADAECARFLVQSIRDARTRMRKENCPPVVCDNISHLFVLAESVALPCRVVA